MNTGTGNAKRLREWSLALTGFTLVELSMLIAVLALGCLLLVPALARTKPNSQGIHCLNNLRRFTAAWTMYSEDNLDRVGNNFTITEIQNAISTKTYANWANDVMSWDSNQMNTNTYLLRVGVMAPYLSGDLDVYRCPADQYLSPLQIAGRWTSRVRSISMNGFLGRAGTGADPTAQGLNLLYSQYTQFLKLGQIPKPAHTWVAVDEHPDSINDGYFINGPQQTYWGDQPACYHNGGCGFSFADDHCEVKKWLSSASQIPVSYIYRNYVFDSAGRQDFAWYLQRTGYVDANSGKPQFGY